MRSRPRLPVQLVPITTKMSSSNPVRGEVNSIQQYVIKFVEYPIINDKNVFFFRISSNVLGTNDDTFTELWTSVHAFFFFLWFFSNIFVFVSVPWLVLLSFYLFLFFLFSSFRKCVTMTSRNDFIIKVSLDRSIDRYMWPSTLYTKYI
jgi:hypothetical protein